MDDRRVRPPAVAGTFYPADPDELRAAVRACLDAARPDFDGEPAAVVVPHAGYAYSGPVAATAYALLERHARRRPFERVVVVGPAHYVPLFGLAVPGADAFATPLGEVAVDEELRALALAHPAVTVDDRAHAPEHSLEVQLPFLQVVLGDVPVLPMVAGRVRPEEVAGALARVWADPATLLVVSTDLSHYHDYDTAVAIDRQTVAAVCDRRPSLIGDEQACGSRPLRGLLILARERGMAVAALDVRNSGDTAGDRDRVVGYASFAVSPAA
jgi:AmmeMemoRadiSam system protein B